MRREFIGRRLQQPPEIGEEPHLNQRDAVVRLGSEQAAEQTHGLRRVISAHEVMPVTQGAVLVFSFGQKVELARLRRRAALHDADGHIGPPVERVHGVYKGGGLRVVLGDRHGEQLDRSARLKSVDYAQRHHVVRVVAHVGVKNEFMKQNDLSTHTADIPALSCSLSGVNM